MAPYSPQQYGVAKRMNQTLIELAILINYLITSYWIVAIVACIRYYQHQ